MNDGPKFPDDPAAIELKVVPADGSLNFWIRAEKGDKNFEILLLWAQLMVSKLEDEDG